MVYELCELHGHVRDLSVRGVPAHVEGGAHVPGPRQSASVAIVERVGGTAWQEEALLQIS